MVEQRAMLKDRDWQVLEGDACRVVDFTPMAVIENGKVRAPSRTLPYASVTFECTKLPQVVDGFICHKVDFMNLSSAMQERSLRENTEVLMFWNKKHLRGYAKLFSNIMPRFCFMLCPKGAFELLTNNAHRPEQGGEARFLAMRPIMEWTPEGMK
jgi:hypothetical protein